MSAFRPVLAAAAVMLVGLQGNDARAQTPEQFYSGKAIDFIIGYPPGGSNDIWARLLARHIGKHIPGKPLVVPKNTPGAGSFLAVNTVYSASPKDGTARPLALVLRHPLTADSDGRLALAPVTQKGQKLNHAFRSNPLVCRSPNPELTPNAGRARQILSAAAGTSV